MDLITGVGATGSALNAQKTRLDLIAQNIANAQTTRSADGGPYKRQVVTFEAQLANRMQRSGQAAGQSGVKVASISNDRAQKTGVIQILLSPLKHRLLL
jgi:flagellar basal-body rod protein FlgC